MKKILWFLAGFILLLSAAGGGTAVALVQKGVVDPPSSSPAQTISAGTPQELIIPKLGVDISVENVGLTAQGAMDVPVNPNDVGWYQFGPKPGEAGNAVIDGHLDQPGGPSVFYHLGNLVPGDIVTVVDNQGKTYNFQVTKTESYPDGKFPISSVFGESTTSNLNLITCTGKWDRANRNYLERLVVYTMLTS